jgi:hypothetical protein
VVYRIVAHYARVSDAGAAAHNYCCVCGWFAICSVVSLLGVHMYTRKVSLLFVFETWRLAICFCHPHGSVFEWRRWFIIKFALMLWITQGLGIMFALTLWKIQWLVIVFALTLWKTQWLVVKFALTLWKTQWLVIKFVLTLFLRCQERSGLSLSSPLLCGKHSGLL